ncbi:MAG: TIGR04376 family protein [Synechococcales cyanobacterium RU_4_20]|nr:TIGR04376 family protein [Synechococcales cyanobacterium RU_4_20]NJR69612.1 TIGR04376 family protein [Synechococcales cyanobacterium CRU_2_2]
MSLFDDLSRILEDRLEEFLRDNPHLELQALEEQLQQQESDAIGLMADLQRQERQLKDNILSTAKEVQLWHERTEKARKANRQDLVQPAQEREAALLRQGNMLWGQMQGIKERLERTKDLVKQIQIRRKEVRAKVTAAQATQAASRATSSAGNTWENTGWDQNVASRPASGDDLDEQFRKWELEEEIEQLKREIRP